MQTSRSAAASSPTRSLLQQLCTLPVSRGHTVPARSKTWTAAWHLEVPACAGCQQLHRRQGLALQHQGSLWKAGVTAWAARMHRKASLWHGERTAWRQACIAVCCALHVRRTMPRLASHELRSPRPIVRITFPWMTKSLTQVVHSKAAGTTLQAEAAHASASDAGAPGTVSFTAVQQATHS